MDQHEKDETRESDTVLGRNDGADDGAEKHNFDASKCVRETELLDKCTSMHAKAPKVKNTINYHLQRLARLARVAR